jgi:transcriptional regulator with XRE-family HTH domain
MPKIIAPSPSIARMLRERRMELGLSLRAVEERSGTLGDPIAFTTVASIELGRVEPGVKRLNTLLRLYDLPPTVAAELLDLEAYVGDLSVPDTAQALYTEGVAHWRRGNLREALAHVFALKAQIARDPGERLLRQKALLFFSVAVGGVGKFNLARRIVEDLLLEGLEPSLRVPILVQAATCWHSLGSAEAALAFLARAEGYLEEGDHANRAWVHHLRASVLLAAGGFEKVPAALRAALDAYRAAGDMAGEVKLVALQFRLLFERGDHRKALEVARGGREAAEQHGYARQRTMRRLEEGRALLALGQSEAGFTALTDALSQGIATGDSALQFYGHFHLWKAHVARGASAAAELDLRACQYHLRSVDEITPETSEIREMLRGTVVAQLPRTQRAGAMGKSRPRAAADRRPRAR